MLKPVTLFALIVWLLAACAQPFDLPADGLESLAGATPVVGVTSRTFRYGGNPQDVKVETIAVTGQPFTTGWRVTSLRSLPTPYSAQLSATSTAAIAKDDVLLVRFYVRSLGTSQSAQTEFVLEEGPPNYTKSVTLPIKFGPSWTLVQVPFKAHRNFAVGEASAHFRLGYSNQSFELGGITLSSYQKTRTVSSIRAYGFNYPGRDPTASWRQAANTRIDNLRKGNLTVRVVDASGNAVSGASVKVEMQRHAFPFGSAVDANQLFSNQTYQNNVLKLFNRVVLENDLKWPSWECCNREVALRALDFFQARGISVRGHNLIWPTEGDFILPDDVRTLVQQGNSAAVRGRIDEHFVDILGATQGKIVEWDVINEPSANKFVTNLLGEDELAVWLRRAKALEPNAKLFINDYGNLGEGNLDVEYKRILNRMKTLGAPLEGIGLQGHFSWGLTPPEELYTRLSSFGRIVPNLSITEFDINITDESLQADYLRDALTVAFSHPNVTSFLMWGFWEGQHWLPDAALYRQDWTIKPNGRVWNDLIFRQWWTNVTGTSSSTGSYSTRGFLGDYKITVTKNGKSVIQTITLIKAGTTVTLTLR